MPKRNRKENTWKQTPIGNVLIVQKIRVHILCICRQISVYVQGINLQGFHTKPGVRKIFHFGQFFPPLSHSPSRVAVSCRVPATNLPSAIPRWLQRAPGAGMKRAGMERGGRIWRKPLGRPRPHGALSLSLPEVTQSYDSRSPLSPLARRAKC